MSQYEVLNKEKHGKLRVKTGYGAALGDADEGAPRARLAVLQSANARDMENARRGAPSTRV